MNYITYNCLTGMKTKRISEVTQKQNLDFFIYYIRGGLVFLVTYVGVFFAEITVFCVCVRAALFVLTTDITSN